MGVEGCQLLWATQLPHSQLQLSQEIRRAEFKKAPHPSEMGKLASAHMKAVELREARRFLAYLQEGRNYVLPDPGGNLRDSPAIQGTQLGISSGKGPVPKVSGKASQERKKEKISVPPQRCGHSTRWRHRQSESYHYSVHCSSSIFIFNLPGVLRNAKAGLSLPS